MSQEGFVLIAYQDKALNWKILGDKDNARYDSISDGQIGALVDSLEWPENQLPKNGFYVLKTLCHVAPPERKKT